LKSYFHYRTAGTTGKFRHSFNVSGHTGQTG